MRKIGVLALQGAFFRHLECLNQLCIKSQEVRKPQDLEGCDGLIIPGGESTTIFHHLKFIHLYEKLKEFAKHRPVFGTCAGLILMSREVRGGKMTPLGLLDIATERNAFGHQADSFVVPIELTFAKPAKIIPAMFIRAPRIRDCGSEVNILARYNNEPILVQQGMHLGATFHPELTPHLALHEYFFNVCVKPS